MAVREGSRRVTGASGVARVRARCEDGVNRDSHVTDLAGCSGVVAAVQRRGERGAGGPARRQSGAARARGHGAPDYGYLRCLAICGDAQGMLDALASDRSFGVFLPIHAEWRSDAERKLHRGR